MTEVAEETTTSKRREVTKRSFLSKDGSYTSRATTDTIGFRIEFAENGHLIEAKLSDFADNVRNAAAAFGFVTSITNTFGGIKGPVEDQVEAAEDRLAVLLEGDWSAERQSGPRNSQLVEAFKAMRADSGVTTDDARIAKFVEDLKDEAYAKSVLKDAKFAAKLAAIKAAAAAERAKRLAGAAQDSEESALLD